VSGKKSESHKNQSNNRKKGTQYDRRNRVSGKKSESHKNQSNNRKKGTQ